METISSIQSSSAVLPQQEAAQEAVSVLPNVNDSLFTEVPSDKTEAFYNSTVAIEIPAEEYNAIRADQDLSFTALMNKYGFEKTLSVLSKETVKQKFEAEFGAVSNEVFKGELLTVLLLAALNKHGIISDDQMNEFSIGLKEGNKSLEEAAQTDVQVEQTAPVAVAVETSETTEAKAG